MKRILIILLSLIINHTYAQELDCQVGINFNRVQGTNKQVFESLRRDITDFMNTTRWTQHVFAREERIKCAIMISISDYNGTDQFKGTIQVTSTRPIYNTSLNSPILNYKEQDGQFVFKYIENQPLHFNPNSHSDGNLVDVLAFYAYIIIGLDYDSFSELGGSEFYSKAQKIVDLAQSSAHIGWKPYESRNRDNRYFLIDALTDKSYEPFRKAIYVYHRLGLDVMTDKLAQGRGQIYKAIEMIRPVHREHPVSILLQTFFNTKADEIVNIYSGAPPQEKQKIYNLLQEIDVMNSKKYEKIIK